jgi:hypothetical protein
MQSNRASGAARPEILELHLERRGDAGKAVGTQDEAEMIRL